MALTEKVSCFRDLQIALISVDECTSTDIQKHTSSLQS